MDKEIKVRVSKAAHERLKLLKALRSESMIVVIDYLTAQELQKWRVEPVAVISGTGSTQPARVPRAARRKETKA